MTFKIPFIKKVSFFDPKKNFNVHSNLTSHFITFDISDTPNDEQWSKLVKEIESHFEENEEILEQMELEIRSWGHELQIEKQKADHRLQSYKVELQRLKKEFQKGVKTHQRSLERDQLGLGDGSYHDLENQRQGLLDNTETLERSSRKLRQGHSLLAETESIGASILNDLSDQRETIQRSRSKVGDSVNLYSR